MDGARNNHSKWYNPDPQIHMPYVLSVCEFLIVVFGSVYLNVSAYKRPNTSKDN